MLVTKLVAVLMARSQAKPGKPCGFSGSWPWNSSNNSRNAKPSRLKASMATAYLFQPISTDGSTPAIR